MMQRSPLPSDEDARLELARAVHDIANLIMTIEGHAAALRGGLGPGESARVAEAIFEATRRGHDLCRRILGDGDPHGTGTVDACEIVARVVRMHETALPGGVVLERSLAEGPVDVALDAGELARAIDNLIVNAIEALLPPGGRIRIAVRPEADPGRGTSDGAVTLIVEDDGPGMSGEVLARAFEPGFTTRRSGSGLGLATVRALVEGAGGCVNLESTPGAGTRCVLKLPSRKGRREAGGRARCVLVVEPDDSVRRLIERILRSRGYRSILVADASAALAVASDARSSLVAAVIDASGSDGSARAVAEALRRESPDAGVVLIRNGGPIEGSLPSGVVVLAKPFGPCDLLRALRGEAPAGDPRPT